jgi:HK97 family phage major capsid protein
MTIEHINRISEERANAWHQAKELLDGAAAEKRELSGEEQATFDKITADLDLLDGRRSVLLDAIKRDKDIEESRISHGVSAFAGPEDDEPDDNEAIRSLMRGEIRSHTFEKRANTKANVYGATPTSVYDRIVGHLIQGNPLLEVGTVITTNAGETLNIPTTSAYSTASIVGDGSQASTSDPTFVNVRSLSAYKYVVLTQLSNEMAADGGVDVGGFLARQAGTAIGAATRGHMTTGSGSGQPYGIATNATTGVTGATGTVGVFTGDNLIDLTYSVTAPYRAVPNAGFMMSSATMGKARKLRADNGTYGSTEYLFTPGLQGMADTLLGYPVFINESVAATALSAKSVLFGDFSSYYVRQVGGIEVAVSNDFAFDYSVSTYRVTYRADGVLVDQTGAVKCFVGGAS